MEKTNHFKPLVIVGLGNPTPRYALTRHNLGFLVVERCFNNLWRSPYNNTQQLEIEKPKKICHSLVFSLKVKDLPRKELLFVQPLTYMNDSGRSVLALKSHFHLKKEDIYVINDDVDLPFGSLRVREHGGSGSHNGLRSIVNAIGKNFLWWRAGIANKEYPTTNIEHFVLSPFAREEQEQLPQYLDFISTAIVHSLENGVKKTINEYNKKHFLTPKKEKNISIVPHLKN